MMRQPLALNEPRAGIEGIFHPHEQPHRPNEMDGIERFSAA